MPGPAGHAAPPARSAAPGPVRRRPPRDVLGVDERLDHAGGRRPRGFPGAHRAEQVSSLTFWQNQLPRRTVHSVPLSRTALSMPLPDSSTSRRTPRAAASLANAPGRRPPPAP
ncbi:hypothetical protein [Streptomyces marincola]|uniref:hypothetical protein n=1 Tax=Streptomyces marincola TaxID=2878388 RepID=UPI00131E1B86|nr:hypothetical protein [Streptomyces marincola]